MGRKQTLAECLKSVESRHYAFDQKARESVAGGADGRYRTTQSVSELLAAAAREGLHPHRFSLMHVAPTDWSKLNESIAPANLKFPDGTLQ
jgi:hypothetical protein